MHSTTFFPTRTIFAAILLGILLSSGCKDSSENSGGAPQSSRGGNDSGATEGAEKKIAWLQFDKDKLPGVEDFYVPLDENKLELAPTEGWNILPKKPAYLIAFGADPAKQRPMIVFNKDSNYELYGVNNLDHLNLEPFANSIMAEQKTEKVRMVELGELLGVTYTKRMKDSSGPSFDHFFLVTVIEGNRYTFRLIADEGELDKYRDNLLAVVKGMKITMPRTEQTSQPPAPKDETTTVIPPPVIETEKPSPPKPVKPESEEDELERLLRGL